MKKHFVIYTKNDCMPCKMTHKFLVDNDLEFSDDYHGDTSKSNLIDVENADPDKVAWSISKIESIKSKYNITSMPIVKVVDDKSGELLDIWGGFNPGKLNHWKKQMRA